MNTTKKHIPKELLTKEEIADRLRCSQRHIDNLTDKGAIRRIMVGNLCRYDWAENLKLLTREAK